MAKKTKSEINENAVRIIKAMKVGADRAKLDSFILGFEEEGVITTHIEKMNMGAVSRIIVTLFQQMCDFEAGQGNMSPEYRKTMGDLKTDFLGLVKRYNEKFEAIQRSGKTKTG